MTWFMFVFMDNFKKYFNLIHTKRNWRESSGNIFIYSYSMNGLEVILPLLMKSDTNQSGKKVKKNTHIKKISWQTVSSYSRLVLGEFKTPLIANNLRKTWPLSLRINQKTTSTLLVSGAYRARGDKRERGEPNIFWSSRLQRYEGAQPIKVRTLEVNNSSILS